MAKKVNSSGSFQEQLEVVEDAMTGSNHVLKRKNLEYKLNLHSYKWTPKQEKFMELVQDKNTKIILVDGPAGCSKTHLSVFCGLKMLNEHRVGTIRYIRTIIEAGSKSMGSLPGSTLEKLHPFLIPLYDKLDEILCKELSDKLIKDERIIGLPINYLRGSSFRNEFIIGDEAQNYEYKELMTLITRLGEWSKMIICGDMSQVDLDRRSSGSGFAKMFNLFNDQESRDQGIHCFEFGKEDIVRSEILKFIVAKIEEDNKRQHEKWGSN